MNLENKIKFILDGGKSKIGLRINNNRFNWLDPKILRPGKISITPEKISKILRK